MSTLKRYYCSFGEGHLVIESAKTGGIEAIDGAIVQSRFSVITVVATVKEYRSSRSPGGLGSAYNFDLE